VAGVAVTKRDPTGVGDHSPDSCLVVILRRFQLLIAAIKIGFAGTTCALTSSRCEIQHSLAMLELCWD